MVIWLMHYKSVKFVIKVRIGLSVKCDFKVQIRLSAKFGIKVQIRLSVKFGEHMWPKFIFKLNSGLKKSTSPVLN